MANMVGPTWISHSVDSVSRRGDANGDHGNNHEDDDDGNDDDEDDNH
jgi:hypothetical protein